MENSPLVEIFDDAQAIHNVTNIYQGLKKKTVQQMEHEILSNRGLVDDINEQSAKALLHMTQADTLKELHEDEIISSKLHVLLKNEMLKKCGESLFFAKACFGHPSPSKQQKLNATANAFGAPDVLRTCHFPTTIVNSVLAS